MSTSRRKGPAGRWRYTGDVERIYMHVPITVQHGAVIEHTGPPADDGCWEPADDAEVTHRPDNAPGEELEQPAEQQQIPLDHDDTAGE